MAKKPPKPKPGAAKKIIPAAKTVVQKTGSGSGSTNVPARPARTALLDTSSSDDDSSRSLSNSDLLPSSFEASRSGHPSTTDFFPSDDDVRSPSYRDTTMKPRTPRPPSMTQTAQVGRMSAREEDVRSPTPTDRNPPPGPSRPSSTTQATQKSQGGSKRQTEEVVRSPSPRKSSVQARTSRPSSTTQKSQPGTKRQTEEVVRSPSPPNSSAQAGSSRPPSMTRTQKSQRGRKRQAEEDVRSPSPPNRSVQARNSRQPSVTQSQTQASQRGRISEPEEDVRSPSPPDRSVQSRTARPPSKSKKTVKGAVGRKKGSLYRPQSGVLREIKYLQSTQFNLIPKVTFQRVCREITQGLSTRDFRYTGGALMALQASAEAFICGFFEDSNLLAAHAKRKTLMEKDMRLAYRIRGENKSHFSLM